MFAKVTSRNIADLDPAFQPYARNLIERAKHLNAFITDGCRTMDRQADLYAQGRTKPGAIVTQAAPGWSYHNYGLAIDVAFVRNGVISYDADLYDRLFRIAAEIGIESLYKIAGFDKPHFQYPGTSIEAIRKNNGVKPMPENNQELLNKLEGKTYIVSDGPNKAKVYLVKGKQAHWANPDAETAYVHGLSLDHPDFWLSQSDDAKVPKGAQLQFKDGWLVKLFREIKSRGAWEKINKAI